MAIVLACSWNELIVISINEIWFMITKIMKMMKIRILEGEFDSGGGIASALKGSVIGVVVGRR